MNDRQAFIAKIIETPDDDAPRYAYADWLRDQGEDELADFIQMQLANPEPNYDMLRYGNFQLFRKYANDLLNLLFTKETNPALAPSDIIEIRRGFVESIAISASCFEANAEKILASHPITEVRLTSLPKIGRVHAVESQHSELGEIVYGADSLPLPFPIKYRFCSNTGKNKKFDTAEECYAEWESQWPRIKFVRPEYDLIQFPQGGLLTLPQGWTTQQIPTNHDGYQG